MLPDTRPDLTDPQVAEASRRARARGPIQLEEAVPGAKPTPAPSEGGQLPRPLDRIRRRQEILKAGEEGLDAKIPWTRRRALPAASGKRQRTVFPGDDTKVETEYVVLEAEELRASHTPDYQQRTPEEFPPEIQGRAYHGPRGRQAREHTESIVSGFDPDRAYDLSISAAEGPPVITRQGVNVAGNGRTIAMQRLYQVDPERATKLLKDELVARAEEFGLDPDEIRAMERPVLARQIVDEGVNQLDVAELRRLNQASDAPSGKAKDVLSDAASRAEQLRGAEGALRHFSETVPEDATIRAYLETKDGGDFLRKLIDDGVITRAERARFIDASTGAATAEGKQLIERMMYATAIGDADVVARAPEGVLRKIDSSLPALVRASRIEGWAVGETLREAIDVLASARATNQKLDDFLAQVDLERPPVSDRVADMARFLDRSKKADIRDAFRGYAEEAEAFTRQTETEDLFGFEPRGAEDAGERFAAMALFRWRRGQGPRGNMFQELTRAEREAYVARREAREAQEFAARFSVTPMERSVAAEAGGAARTEARSVPPGRQTPAARSQVSTEPVRPSETTRATVPSTTEGGERVFRTAIVDPSSGRNITQPVSDPEELVRRAEALLPKFRRALQAVVAEIPGVTSFDGARSKGLSPRLFEKIEGGSPANTLSDLLGGRLAVDTPEDAELAIRALERQGWRRGPWDDADEDFFDNPKPGGYRARHVQLVAPDGSMSVELQFRVPEIARVQEAAHKHYDVFRGSVQASAQEIEAARAAAQKLFDDAWAAFERRRGVRDRRVMPRGRAPGELERRSRTPRRLQETLHPMTDLFGEDARVGERVKSAAVRTPDGKVHQGAVHAQIQRELVESGRLKAMDPELDGFVTSTGRFVSREEANAIAEAADQIQDPSSRFRADGGLASDELNPMALPRQFGEQLPGAGRFYDKAEAVDAAVVSPRAVIQGLTAALDKALPGLGLKTGSGPLPKPVQRIKGIGVYDSRRQVLRQLDLGDVGVFGHEAGHVMHQVFFGKTPKGQLQASDLEALPGAIRGELEDLGQGISTGGIAEGWAEVWRRYLDNPEALAQEAPNTLRFIEERLEGFPELREAWHLARSDWQAFRESSAQARVAARISVGDRETDVLSLSDRWSRARTAILDDLEPIRRVVEKIRENVGLKGIEEEADTLARLVRGSAGVGTHFLEHGVLDFRTLRKVGPALRQVLEPVKAELDDFRRYMVSRRAQELHGREIVTGLRAEDVDTVVRQLEAKHGDSFKAAFDGIQAWNDGLLKYLRDAGVISADSYKAIRELNQSYVPFYRVIEGESGAAGLGQNFGHLFSPVKRIKGSGRDIVDPLESMVKNAMNYAHIAQKQQVSRALAALADKPGVGKVLEQLGTPIRRTQLRLGEIEGKLEGILPGADELLEDLRARAEEDFKAATADLSPDEIRQAGITKYDPAEEILAIFRPGDYMSRPNTISVLQDGRRVWYEVDPELYASLEGLNREQLDAFARFMGAPARTLRAGATLAPEFLIRNPLRDQVMAFIQSEHGYVPFVDMARGVFELLRKGEAYQQWISAGGYRAALTSLDRKSMQNAVRALVDEGGVRNVIKHPFDALQALSALMEDATRMGEFLKARAVHGTTKAGLQRSAAAAREISVDFARHGAKTAALRHISAFWNARLQGYDRMARAAKRNPARFAGFAFGAITVPSLLEYYVNMDDPEYWEQPQWKRDLFWLFKLPGTDGFVAIPKPFELGLVFGTLPVRVLDAAIGGPGGGHELRGFLEEALVKGELSGFAPQPTALMPLLENATNYSFFLRRPIVPRSEQDVRAEFQAGPYTSEVAQLLGRWAPGAGVSPRKIDNLLYAWTGGLGRIGTEATDPLLEGRVPFTEGDVPPVASDFFEIPGIRGITDPQAGFSSESVERFYQRLQEARVAVRTLSFLEGSEDDAAYQEELDDEELSELRSLAPTLNATADQLAELRSQVEAIRRDPGMSSNEKREAIEELGLEARSLAQSVLDRELPGGG